jgi:hypothetical protein
MIKRHTWTPITVEDVTAQLLLRTRKSLVVVILATRSERLMLVSLGHLDEARTLSNASANITEKD